MNVLIVQPQKLKDIIRELLGDEIKLIYCQSGSDNISSMSQTNITKGENSASLKVILTHAYASRTEEVISLIDTYLKNIPDIETSFTREETALQSSLGTSKAPFSLEISGKEYEELERIVTESRNILQGN